MEKWKIFNLMPTFTAIFLAFIASYFIFNSDILIVKLFGVVSLSIAVIIQIYLSQMVYVRDISILKELKYFEGLLESTRTDMKDIPSYIETNNSKIDGYIKSNNLDMSKYIDSKNVEMAEYIKSNNLDISKYIDEKISQVINVIEERYRK